MKLAEFGKLTEAEQAVVDGLGTGHVTVLGDGELPAPEAGDDRQVHASLIRWLALGAPGDGAVRLHEKGLRIAGALVVSDGQADPLLEKESTPGLDLEGGRLDRGLVLAHCRFKDTPVLRGVRVDTLNLHGSHLPGLRADRLEARGDVFLRGVQAAGEIRLLGARIDGDLSCTDGRFENADGKALSADRLEARGDVFLRGVQATGEVRLPGARIGGDLDCQGGRFETKGGRALNADGARVTGVLFWRNGCQAEGSLDLTAAEIGHINDDPACWPGPGDLVLDRCRYGAFTGHGINAGDRIRWLDLQAPARFGKDFWPQPWEHCAHVLREMGHAEDARAVLIAKEERQRRGPRAQAAGNLSKIRRRIAKVERDADPNDIEARLAARSGLVGAWLELAFLRLRDWLLAALIAYGHRPLQALGWLAGMWLLGAVLFGVAYGDGGFKPNNAFILRSAEWAQCADGGDRWAGHSSTLDCYLDQPEAAGYPAFNAPLYSLDTLVPVVDLEVQDYWVPDGAVAAWARAYLWVHIAMGWFLALLAVAGFSGLIDTRATKD
ncbi:hypothetical protein [Sediminimonas sp.]|uniref:hypothetical protein n=1 Tax=Sediminimonas sp. TaxID=2823379 RepID=UPI0025E2EC1B|nr:hypothetical protein [Sediminimonas sp.]